MPGNYMTERNGKIVTRLKDLTDSQSKFAIVNGETY